MNDIDKLMNLEIQAFSEAWNISNSYLLDAYRWYWAAKFLRMNLEGRLSAAEKCQKAFASLV